MEWHKDKVRRSIYSKMRKRIYLDASVPDNWFLIVQSDDQIMHVRHQLPFDILREGVTRTRIEL